MPLDKDRDRTNSVSQTISGSHNTTFGIGSLAGPLTVSPGPLPPARPEPPGPVPREPGTPGKVRIVFLGANPLDSVRLQLDAEVREIEAALSQAEFGDRFEVHQKWAVRASDLQGHLLRHRPHIVHFSGHGSENDAIFLEGSDGRPHAVDATYLARLFQQFRSHLRCVVLNACYSESQARAIATSVDAVIGMSTTISDQAAIRFSANFYQALAYGESVHAAYQLACADVAIGELGEAGTPQLLGDGEKASRVVFVGESAESSPARPTG